MCSLSISFDWWIEYTVAFTTTASNAYFCNNSRLSHIFCENTWVFQDWSNVFCFLVLWHHDWNWSMNYSLRSNRLLTTYDWVSSQDQETLIQYRRHQEHLTKKAYILPISTLRTTSDWWIEYTAPFTITASKAYFCNNSPWSHIFCENTCVF